MTQTFISSAVYKVGCFLENLFTKEPELPGRKYQQYEKCLGDAVCNGWNHYRARVRVYQKSELDSPVLLVTYRFGDVHDYLFEIVRAAKQEFYLDKVIVVTHIQHWVDPMRSMFPKPRFCLAKVGPYTEISDLTYEEFFDLSGVDYFEVYDDDQPPKSFSTHDESGSLLS